MEIKQILKIDFYDLCGSAAIFMSDEDKITWMKETDEKKTITPNQNQ